MKDADDTATIELFPTTKKRGRPATGKAKTPAQRQEKYRENKRCSGENIKENINIWIESQTIRALERLAKSKKITKIEMLNLLIDQADKKAAKKASETGKWEEYWE
jgi:hypothetical protein